jgi:hypothetical protein
LFAAATLCAAFLTASPRLSGQTRPAAQSEGWVSLFNGKNFDGWYNLLPSTGRNNDPTRIFKMESGMVQFRNIRIRPLP